ncbi:MAG: hypothetical protein SVG88_07130 [Halobacteriales archaeon]|nr:hypothetical protein [Halobacteriales archaeon]
MDDRERVDTSEPTADREAPVGEPVIRGDDAVTGDQAGGAVRFDPEDPESVRQAAETVAEFAIQADDAGREFDSVYMLRGAAACAALVQATGSYKTASERAGEPATVAFIRKWARVHDLPPSIRAHVARGELAPSAAKHIARVSGEARYLLAWGTLDHDLTVREIRSIASDITDGESPEAALDRRGIALGELTVELPLPVYRELRRTAALEGAPPGDIIATTLRERLGE